MMHPRLRARSMIAPTLMLVFSGVLVLTLTNVAAAASLTKPVAKAPGGTTVYSSWVKYTWGKVNGATSYQVQVYIGDMNRLVRMSPWVKSSSWTASEFDPYYNYTWRVRARNASGRSRWSKLLPHFRIDDSLEAWWTWGEDDGAGHPTASSSLLLKDDVKRSFTSSTWSGVLPTLGTFTVKAKWRATSTTLTITDRRRSWSPDPGDASGVAAYSGKALGDVRWNYQLGDWEYSYGLEKMVYMSLTVSYPDGTQRKFWRHVSVTD